MAITNRLFFVELQLDGRPLAMTANFVQGTTLFAFKVAYDPEFARVSPGILSELQTIRLFHEDGRLELGDSGTAGPSYIDGYWNASTRIQRVLISTGSWSSRFLLSLISRVTRLKRRLAAHRTATASTPEPTPE
jgi:CelD/BcsL family acetyltransferase involved in cellulose biosynthesis